MNIILSLIFKKIPPCGNFPILLRTSSIKVHASRYHFFFIFFSSPDFHELCRSVMSICLFTEVKQQWATLVLGWVIALVYYLCL